MKKAMEIKLKAEHKNNARAKHLLKLVRLGNSDEHTKQIEAVKVFLLNLSSTNPVDLIPIPKDVDNDISESMFECIRLRSHSTIMLADYFKVPKLNRGKLPLMFPVAKARGTRTVADLLIEDRGDCVGPRSRQWQAVRVFVIRTCRGQLGQAFQNIH